MTYGQTPLYPPPPSRQSAMRMPLFDNCGCCATRDTCQCVQIRNPACPEEYADVELCVDEGGNLSICVKRPPKPCCPPRRHRPRYGCQNW